MNILLVGNKPSENKIDYKNYDMICQVNRMNNIMNIPKVDLWYCDLHPFFFDLPSCILKSKCDLSQTKILIHYFIQIDLPFLPNTPFLINNNIHPTLINCSVPSSTRNKRRRKTITNPHSRSLSK